MRRRGEARRRDREQLVAARARRGDDDREPLVAQQQLLAAVMDLEPDDRRVVSMRFLDELPPRVIAQRLGTTSAAVRSRLSRALGVLRARLAPGGDRRSLLLALSPLLPGGTAAATKTLLLGTLLMKGKMLAGIAAALLVAIGSWLWWPDPAGPVGVSEGGRATVANTVVEASPLRGAAAAEEAAVTERVQMTSTPPTVASAPSGATDGRLIVTARCVDERRQPLPGAKVSSTLRGRPFALADADGRVRLEMAWPPKRAPGGGAWLQVEAGVDGRVTLLRERDVSPRGGEVALGEFVLAPAGGLTGLVRNAHGGAAAGVHVWVAQAVLPIGGEAEQLRRAFGGPHFRRLADEVQAVVTTDAQGRYRFDALPCLEASVIVEPKRALCSYSSPVQIVAGQIVEVPPIVVDEPSANGRIAGVVLDADCDGLAGMAVQLMPNRSGRNGSALAQQTTGGDGAFEFVVPPGRQFTVVVMGTGRDGRRRAVHDVASGTTGLRIEFAAPRALELSVTGPNGEVVQPGNVTGLSADGFGMLLATRPGADGAEERLLPDETFSLVVSAKGYRSKAVGPFEPASVGRIEVQLERASTLSGRVMAAGAPVAGAKVHVHRLDERQPFHRFTHGVFTRLTMASRQVVACDADGRFELTVQLDGDYVVHAEADGWARGSSEELAVRDGGAVGPPVEIELPRPADLDVQTMVAEGDAVEAQLIAATTGDGHV
ncbi:MAG: sigma factor-like helix-turn-helix DNA-binding protein, partial [Planctomycetota bacterium]